MESEEKIKIMIHSVNGEIQEFEGYTFLGSMVKLPKSASIQITENIQAGRISTGDYLSNVVSSIALALRVMKEKKIDSHTIEDMIEMAIREGLSKG